MAVTPPPPICSLCGNEMTRLKRTGKLQYTPVYACGTGEPKKAPCDGGVVKLGSRF